MAFKSNVNAVIGIQDPCEGMGMGFAAGASCAWQVAEVAETTGIPCANLLLCGCICFFTVSIPCAIIFGVYGIFKGCLLSLGCPNWVPYDLSEGTGKRKGKGDHDGENAPSDDEQRRLYQQ